MRVLGIDCGTEYTGYGVVDQHADGRLEFVLAGAIHLPKRDSMPKRLTTVFSNLSSAHSCDAHALRGRWSRMSALYLRLPTLVLFSLTASQVFSQQQDAIVTFKLSWKDAQPSKYSVVIHRNGQAEYVSEDKGLTSPQERNAPVE